MRSLWRERKREEVRGEQPGPREKREELKTIGAARLRENKGRGRR